MEGRESWERGREGKEEREGKGKVLTGTFSYFQPWLYL